MNQKQISASQGRWDPDSLRPALRLGAHPVFLDLGGWSPPPPAGVAPRFPQGVLTAVRTCAGPGAPLRPRVGSACAACGSHPPSLGAGLRARPPSPCNPRLGLSMSADLWLPDPGLLSPHSRPSPTLPRPLVPGRLPRSACGGAPPPPQDPSPLRGTPGSSLRSPAAPSRP